MLYKFNSFIEHGMKFFHALVLTLKFLKQLPDGKSTGI